MYKIAESQWVGAPNLYLEGYAGLWFQAYTQQILTELMTTIVDEFGQDEFNGQMTRLMHLKQVGTVAEYRRAF
jgi:hypothetical protein